MATPSVRPPVNTARRLAADFSQHVQDFSLITDLAFSTHSFVDPVCAKPS
jgi:hypothetical protein